MRSCCETLGTLTGPKQEVQNIITIITIVIDAYRFIGIIFHGTNDHTSYPEGQGSGSKEKIFYL